MCGRVNVSDHEGLRALLAMMGMQIWPISPPGFNIAPTANVDVVTLGNDGDALKLTTMHWGFPITGPNNSRRLLFNARSETVFNKPAFRSSAMSQRAIVPVNGFYEWQSPAQGFPRLAFHIQVAHAPAFALAAIYRHSIQATDTLNKKTKTAPQAHASQLSLDLMDDMDDVKNDMSTRQKSRTPEKEKLIEHDVCVLTMAATQEMRVLHDRMPLILNPEQAKRWLQEGDEPILNHFCQQAAGTKLSIQHLNGFVNNAANEGPECLARAVE